MCAPCKIILDQGLVAMAGAASCQEFDPEVERGLEKIGDRYTEAVQIILRDRDLEGTVAEVAAAVGTLAENGDLTDEQLNELSTLDLEWIHAAIRIIGRGDVPIDDGTSYLAA